MGRLLFITVQFVRCLLLLFCVACGHTQQQAGKLIVIAHRGDHTTAPENTLKAFSDAIATGVDYVEVDVRSTRDGELVVMHDATIDRMTTTHGKVNDFNWQELQKLEVIDKVHPEFGKHAIPSFSQVLQLCKGKTGIYLDFKDGNIEKAWQLIREHGMANNVVVYLNSEDQLDAWKKHAPGVPLMASLPDSVKSIESYRRFQSIVHNEIVDGNYRDYNAALVRGINENGQSVWIDVQSPDENERVWSKVLALGVQGMQTDHPRELIRWREGLK